jgi:hypothetical protein
MAAPAPKIDPKRLRPSRFWYWVAGAIAVGGVLLAGFLFFSILRPLFDDVERFSTARPATVKLDAGDERTIYAQTDGSPFPGARFVDVSPSDLDCIVVGGPSGRQAEVSRADGFTYTRNEDRYQAKLEFKAPSDGTYVVRCRARGAAAPVALAVGPHFGTVGFVARLLGFFAALFGGPLLGGLLAGGVALLRHRSKKRLQEEERGSWPPPGGSPPPAGPPGAAPPPPPFMDAGR